MTLLHRIAFMCSAYNTQGSHLAYQALKSGNPQSEGSAASQVCIPFLHFTTPNLCDSPAGMSMLENVYATCQLKLNAD
jgi:hypothetical protein